MKSSYKSFDRDLCNKSDLPAKQVAVELFTQRAGCTLTVPLESQPEMYKAWDFFMTSSEGKKVTIEVERSYCWRYHLFYPYETCHYLGRKFESKAQWFLQTNKHCNFCWVSRIETLMKFPTELVDTRFTKDEPMKIIPKEYVTFYQRDESGVWQKVQSAKPI